jgi:membrane protease YdiL (CAAX protease family)
MFEEMKVRYFVGLAILITLVFEWVLSMYVISEELSNIILGFAVFELAASLFFGYYFYKQKTSIHEVVHDRDTKRWFPSVFWLVLIFNTFSITTYWFYLFIQDSFFILDPFMVNPLTGSSAFLIVVMMMSSVTGPIAEEFIFRGLLLNRIIKKTNMWGGILISSLVFAVVHMQAEKLIATFLFGVVASLIYLKTRNLFIPILIHILHNSVVFIQTSVFPAWREFLFFSTYSTDIQTNIVLKSTFLVISSIMMIVVIVYLAKDLRTDQKKAELLPQHEGLH